MLEGVNWLIFEIVLLSLLEILESFTVSRLFVNNLFGYVYVFNVNFVSFFLFNPKIDFPSRK